jgi:hypothetical protein
MRRFAQIALLASSCAVASAALAFDNGQYEYVPADVRGGFKGVIAPNGGYVHHRGSIVISCFVPADAV